MPTTYTTQEVADLLRVPLRTVKYWCVQGRLRATRSTYGSGRRYLIEREDLIRFARAAGKRIWYDIRDPSSPILLCADSELYLEPLSHAVTAAGRLHVLARHMLGIGYAAASERPGAAIVRMPLDGQSAVVGRFLRERSIAVAVIAAEDNPNFKKLHPDAADLVYQAPVAPSIVVRDLIAEADRTKGTVDEQR